jgi:hypothetical protein
MASSVVVADSLSPNYVNPVLKTQVTINFGSSFTKTLTNKADFSVNATSTSDSSYYRIMNVLSVDDANKRIVCMFGGAWSGDYIVQIRHSEYGLIETDALTLKVGAKVTAVDKTQISRNGGTILTITGQNFGTEITDNPVQVSYNGGLGSTDCFVQSTSAT